MENEDNFLAVLSAQNIEELLSPSDILLIQAKLWDILAKRAESYTMGGSSSVRAETAQELLKSAGFVLRKGIDNGGGPESVKKHLLNDDFDIVFMAGLEAIKEQVKEGQELLETANKTALAVENKAYHDTLKELGVFFKRYHYHHFAAVIPCVLDYPLAHPVDEALLGIDYINDYLHRYLIENDIVSRFDPGLVTLLLRSVSPDYKENLLNIYEAAAANATALTLLKGDIFSLDITENDRGELFGLLNSWQAKNITLKLQAAASELCSFLDINDRAETDYLTETIMALYPRLKQIMKTKQLDAIFPSLYREPEYKKHTVSYIDGALMDNEALRALIGEISSCRYVSDKIVLVKQHIRSLRDYIEILNICFWDEECIALFDALSKEELQHLRLALKQKQSKSPEWTSETGWENYLMDYAKGK